MTKITLNDLSSLQNESTAVANINLNNTAITTAFENTLSRDGTQPNMMNNELDMNSNKIINLPDAISDQEPVTYGQYIEGITSVNNGVVVDGDFVVLNHNDTMINDRVLQAGLNISLVDGGPKGSVTIGIDDPSLNALSSLTPDTDKLPYFSGVGVADVTDFTSFARTLVDDTDASQARDTLGVTIGTDVQPHDNTLDSLVSSSAGILAKDAPDSITGRTIISPAAGISVANGNGIAGDPTISLTNDLAAVEGLTTNGLIARTATDTMTTRTVTGTANEITVSNGSGVSGNPTISIPSSLTLTGKTVTGGTFNSSTINSPSITTPTGITKADVGLSNVDNTSDVTKNSANVTLTNKTIDGGSNTLTNIPTTSISNSAITNAKLANMADSTIKSNISGSSAAPSDNTITAVLDKQLGTAQGTIAYRNSSSWVGLAPGTIGDFLQTQGSGANPAWISIPGGGDMLKSDNLLGLADNQQALNNLGLIDLSIVPTASGTQATEVADFANNKYWLEGRSYPSLMSWLAASDSSFTRSGYAWKQDNTGRYYKIGTNTPRLISDGTGTSKGVLIEGTITNRVVYSEAFTQSVWTKAGCSFAADTSITAPDGTRFATGGTYLKVVEDTANSQHTFYQQCTTVADTAHTASIFVKAGTRSKGFLYFVQSSIGCSVSFDLAAGTVGTPTAMSTGTAISAAIKPYGNGWYRIEITGKIGAGATGGYIQVLMANNSGLGTYTGDGSSYMYVWGAQIEASQPSSSYIPTYGNTTNTRSSEFLYRYYQSQPAAMTKIFKGRTPTAFHGDLSLLVHIDDGTEANDFEIYRDTAGHMFLQLRADWDEQATLDLGLVANDTDFTIAFRGSSVDIAASINGGSVIKQTISDWPSTMVVERYGINATESRFWYSTIAYSATIPVAASDSELIALSS